MTANYSFHGTEGVVIAALGNDGKDGSQQTGLYAQGLLEIIGPAVRDGICYVWVLMPTSIAIPSGLSITPDALTA